MNLADSDEDIEEYLSDADFCSEYYRALYEGGKVVAIDLTGNFYSDDFAASVAEGLTFLARNNHHIVSIVPKERIEQGLRLCFWRR